MESKKEILTRLYKRHKEALAKFPFTLEELAVASPELHTKIQDLSAKAERAYHKGKFLKFVAAAKDVLALYEAMADQLGKNPALLEETRQCFDSLKGGVKCN